MCGRFNILTDIDALMTTFDILKENSQLESFSKRYNISPSGKNTAIGSSADERLTSIPIVRLGANNQRLLRNAIWPLVPNWSGSTVPKYSTANARCESMHSKVSFRNAWQKARRCLIPATGFYEWQNVANQRTKQPWHIFHRDQSVMAFAGLWEQNWDSEGAAFESCSIVTTQANQLMAEIHNSKFRMPVIIDSENWDIWLGGDHEVALRLTVPYAEGRLTANPIATHINNPKYNESDCLNPIEMVG